MDQTEQKANLGDQEIQQNELKMYLLEQEMENAQKQFQHLEAQMQELKSIRKDLDELKKSEVGSEVLSLLSPGIFIKTKLAEKDNVIINVGANVAVKKSLDGARDLINKQIDEVKNMQMRLLRDIQKLDGAMLKVNR